MTKLPLLARKYLRTPQGQTSYFLIEEFHQWLAEKGLIYETIKLVHIRQFLANPLIPQDDKILIAFYRKTIVAYLDWLKGRKQLCFNPELLKNRGHRLAVESCKDYLAELKPTFSSSSLGAVRSNLKRFHDWLSCRNLKVRGLRRHHLVEWFGQLHEEGLHASTRKAIICDVRAYLTWLREKRLVYPLAEKLIKRSDFPKLPIYLPRPISLEIDRFLVEKLSQSDDLIDNAILLLRQTGMRFGEMYDLPYDCLHQDETQRNYIKAPLGKIKKERLIPLDKNALATILKIKNQTRSNYDNLIVTSLNRSRFYSRLNTTLKHHCRHFKSQTPITPHRLRHTYATSLINAGMSLIGVMQLLGHKDYRMTLRYAAITSETVAGEYSKAIEVIESRYGQQLISKTSESIDLITILLHTCKDLEQERLTQNHDEQRKTAHLIRRINRLSLDLANINDKISP